MSTQPARIVEIDRSENWEKVLNSERGWESDSMSELRSLCQERVAAGREVFDLSMINPDLAPARFCIDKLAEASIRPINHRYAVARGIRRLREAFAYKYSTRFGVRINPENEVCVTLGTKDALLQALRVLCAPGDTILAPAPTYPIFRLATTLVGASLSYYSIHSDEDKLLDEIEDALIKTKPTVLLLNFPNNPTGICVTSRFYQRLLPVVERAKCFVLNDFVYGEMGYEGQSLPSLLSVEGFQSRAAETYSLSKAYSLPGWRVGALLGCSKLIEKVSQIKANLDYGNFLPVQHAASVILTTGADLLGPNIQQYRVRARTLVSGLTRIGWEASQPLSGTSVWAKIPAAKGAGVSFAKRALVERGVLATPGNLFGSNFDKWLRFALVRPPEDLEEVVRRLEML